MWQNGPNTEEEKQEHVLVPFSLLIITQTSILLQLALRDGWPEAVCVCDADRNGSQIGFLPSHTTVHSKIQHASRARIPWIF